MNRDVAIARLKAHETELRRIGVLHLYLFGSTARDEAGADSDVDLFFDYERGKFGVYELDGREGGHRTHSRQEGRCDDAGQPAQDASAEIEAGALQVF